MSDRTNKPRADWMSWTMQYFFGLAVGAFLGWMLILSLRDEVRMMRGFRWTLEFCLGSGLFLAGLAAFYGNNLWYGIMDNNQTTEGHRHSKRSAKLAALSFVLGVGIMIAVVMKWMGWVA